MEEWHRLEREVPGLKVAWLGGLIWDAPPDELEAFAKEHASWGYDLRRVDRVEAARLEPHLANPPEFALHAPGEASVEALEATLALIEAAKGLGTQVVTETPVRALHLIGGRARGVETDAGVMNADEVVVAAGVESPRLLEPVGVSLPMESPPGLLVSSEPRKKLLNGLVMSPGLHVRQTSDGRLLAGEDFGGSDPGAEAAAVAAKVFELMKGMFRGGESLSFDSYSVGYRPVPADGFPAIGRSGGVEGLYVAVMHSGVTLAPAVGRFAAEEILNHRRDKLLRPYGLERFS